MFAYWSEDWDHVRDKRKKFRKKKDPIEKNIEEDYKSAKERLEYIARMSKEIQSIENSNINSQQINLEENLKIEILQSIKKIKDLEIDLDTFELIKTKEDEAGLIRMHEVDSYTNELKNKEKRLQQVFEKLSKEIELFKRQKDKNQADDKDSDLASDEN